MSLGAFTKYRWINSLEGMSKLIMSRGTTTKIINTNRRRKIRKKEEL
jgi:hypothetical protein